VPDVKPELETVILTGLLEVLSFSSISSLFEDKVLQLTVPIIIKHLFGYASKFSNLINQIQ
tara:strand:- start:335 stop:517 length:183 start_codon:yes stop_codon:yes gene_type:complete